jgi:signal transduction histidine kinase
MKWRFMAAIMAVILLVVLVQDIPLAGYLQTTEHARLITSLEKDAFVLAGRSQEALGKPTPAVISQLSSVAQTYRKAGGARVVVVDSTGIAIVTSDDDQASVGSDYSSRPEIATALTGQIASGERYSTSLSQQLVYVTVPVLHGDHIVGAVRLTFPNQTVVDQVNSQLQLLIIVAVITLILAGIVGFILSVSVTRRLKLLQRATVFLAEGDLSARADERGAPEIKSLSRSFNLMADRLDGLVAQQRTFAADASHQLRTPLTALRLKLERARGMVAKDPAGAEVRIAAAEAEADRLGNIIEGLLMLSRTEAKSAPIETFNVAAIARARIEHWQPLAAESAIKVRYEGPVAALALAVPTAVEQIIDNFVDNALSIIPAKSTLTVRVAKSATTVELHVLDQGPGMSADDCARAFDRFWRAASDNKGSGLGLAIVAQLARASSATATLTPRPEGGIDASVRFKAP